jgi:hypothetical protein
MPAAHQLLAHSSRLVSLGRGQTSVPLLHPLPGGLFATEGPPRSTLVVGDATRSNSVAVLRDLIDGGTHCVSSQPAIKSRSAQAVHIFTCAERQRVRSHATEPQPWALFGPGSRQAHTHRCNVSRRPMSPKQAVRCLQQAPSPPEGAYRGQDMAMRGFFPTSSPALLSTSH